MSAVIVARQRLTPLAWRPVADLVAAGRPVMIMNRRGRRPSGPLGEDYTVRTEIEDLHCLIDQIGAEVDLFGWSYGGLIACEVATERSDVRTLVAYEPVAAPFVPSAIPSLQEAVGRRDLDRALEIVNLAVAGLSHDHVAELRGTPAWSLLEPLAASVAAELAAINRHEPRWSGYARLEMPVTLVIGERNEGRDPYGTAFQQFADAMPQARVEVLPGQGHLAHVEAPQALARCIDAALGV